jgi:hypothetical protein
MDASEVVFFCSVFLLGARLASPQTVYLVFGDFVCEKRRVGSSVGRQRASYTPDVAVDRLTDRRPEKTATRPLPRQPDD